MLNNVTEVVQQVVLAENQTAIFGYGSLISISSLERTLGQMYCGPRVACSLKGWRRSWDITMPNDSFYTIVDNSEIFPPAIIYLDLYPSEGSSVNGVIYVLEAAQLEQMNRREWIYDTVSVSRHLLNVSVQGGDVIAYVGKLLHKKTGANDYRSAAVRRTYLQMIEEGLNEMGDEFRQKFVSSTDVLASELIIDDRRH